MLSLKLKMLKLLKQKHKKAADWLRKAIETETQTTINKFFKLKQEFDKVNNAAIEQKTTD